MANTKFIDGGDGLLATDVGHWAIEKHDILRTYVELSSGARRRFIGDGNAGACYIDLFCSTGKSLVRETGQWVDGSAVAAWNASKKSGTPFSRIFISDTCQKSVEACEARLKRLDAPVTALCNSAAVAAEYFSSEVNPYGLHVAFIDPYNLASCSFNIIRSLSHAKRMDIIAHISAGDINRNLDRHLTADESAFDNFVPGWRENIDLNANSLQIRCALIEFWKDQVAALGAGKWAAARQKLITGGNNQPLYWLAFIGGHKLAEKFWEVATRSNQGDLF